MSYAIIGGIIAGIASAMICDGHCFESPYNFGVFFALWAILNGIGMILDKLSA